MWVVEDMIGYFGDILFPGLLKQTTLGNMPIPNGRYLDQETGSRDEIRAHSNISCELCHMQQTEVYHYVW